PRREHIAWRHIEFLPLSDRRVLAILVVNEGEVQNRILNLDRSYDASSLQQVSNYLNTHFAGKDIQAVRTELLNELRRTRESMNKLMLAAITMAEKVFETRGRDENRSYVMAGETNLMEWAELSDMEKLRRLFEAFNQRRDILHLLDKCVVAEGVQIFIGEESGYRVLDECSVVTAPYSVGDEVVGVLGVIGPTRMAYERVIPIVDLTARLLGAALNPRK
ncbi:MAG: HrcA family transcriptional regulator, partial [Gammaproteobacteria bacterium]